MDDGSIPVCAKGTGGGGEAVEDIVTDISAEETEERRDGRKVSQLM